MNTNNLELINIIVEGDKNELINISLEREIKGLIFQDPKTKEFFFQQL